jgi:hypothetical protein
MSEPDDYSGGRSGRFPPELPDIDRRVRVYPRQIAGLVVLATIPVLAMVGLLGPQQQRESRATPALDVAVEYPGRVRASRDAVLRIVATNRSASRLDHVRVRLPEVYLGGFADREVARVATPDHEVLVAPLEPGEAGTVQVDLRAERFGRHRGAIRVVSSAGDTLSIPLRTFILP